MKLAQRPKNRPTGAPMTARSHMVGMEILSFLHASEPPTMAPTSPP
jgi:hypothetical protein